jgi:hypothetical protein
MSGPIILNPMTVAPSDSLTICYSSSDGFPLPVTLTLAWTPSGLTPTSVDLTEGDPCVTIAVPATADTLVVKDGRGNSESPTIT